MAMRLAGRGSRALLLSGHELRRPLVTLRLPPPLAACGTLAGRASRGAVGSYRPVGAGGDGAAGGAAREPQENHGRLREVLGASVDYITLDLGPLPKAARVESALGRLVLDVVSAANSVPGGGPAVFLKVPAGYPARAARDTERVEAAGSAAAAALFGGAAGIILAHGEDEELADSGAAAELLSEVYRRTDGRLTLIASGGVRTGREALGLIEAGATVIQISHLLVSEGPQVCRRLKSEMSQALMERNYVSLQDAVGAAHRKKKVKRRNPWKAIGA